jgi:hypothetical protein
MTSATCDSTISHSDSYTDTPEFHAFGFGPMSRVDSLDEGVSLSIWIQTQREVLGNVRLLTT